MAELGQGQFGKVYKAYDMKEHRWVAIKTLPVQRVGSIPKYREFLQNEVKSLSIESLKEHRHIITLVELVTTQNNYYLVYEYCNGGTMEQRVRETQLDTHQALLFIRQIISAFDCLYKRLIMHRDVKLENILLHDESIRVADFGFCKQQMRTDSLNTTIVGSPTYMAPELLAQ